MITHPTKCYTNWKSVLHQKKKELWTSASSSVSQKSRDQPSGPSIRQATHSNSWDQQQQRLIELNIWVIHFLFTTEFVNSVLNYRIEASRMSIFLSACEEGYWGTNCSNICQCSSKDCSPVTGCSSCLNPGLTGPDCSIDINECLGNDSSTNTSTICGYGNCTNTNGAFYCTCDVWYEFNEIAKTCTSTWLLCWPTTYWK